MNLLSIQSHVAYGHVGNSAAMFPLQRLGVEVWPIHTTQLSNHSGYETVRGGILGPEAVGEVLSGLDERGVLAQCDGVLSGYIGSTELGTKILDAVYRVKAANGRARYCCDPVMGDVGRGVFVRRGITEFMRKRAVPAADIVTPNQFELELLSGITARSFADTLQACAAIHALGPATVLVTSLLTDDVPAGSLDVFVSAREGRFRVRTPRLALSAQGTGDAMTALFFHHLLRSGSSAEALSKSVSSLYGVLRRTVEAGAREMLIVQAQDEFVSPTQVFHAEAV